VGLSQKKEGYWAVFHGGKGGRIRFGERRKKRIYLRRKTKEGRRRGR